MLVNELIIIYELERKQPPESINDLLDFYQQRYISGTINITEYRKIYHYLYEQGAVSAHDDSLERTNVHLK